MNRLRRRLSRRLPLLVLTVLLSGASLLIGSPARAQEPDLSAALLTPADLPGVWTTVIRPDREGTRPCGMELGFRPQALDLAEVLYEASPTGPFLQHVVGRYAPGMAAALMEEFRSALIACPEWDNTTADGRTVRNQWLPMESSLLGDDTVAARIEAESGDLFARTHALAVRHGDLVLLLVHTAAGVGMPVEPDADLTKALLQIADARLMPLANAP